MRKNKTNTMKSWTKTKIYTSESINMKKNLLEYR